MHWLDAFACSLLNPLGVSYELACLRVSEDDKETGRRHSACQVVLPLQRPATPEPHGRSCAAVGFQRLTGGCSQRHSKLLKNAKAASIGMHSRSMHKILQPHFFETQSRSAQSCIWRYKRFVFVVVTENILVNRQNHGPVQLLPRTSVLAAHARTHAYPCCTSISVHEAGRLRYMRPSYSCTSPLLTQEGSPPYSGSCEGQLVERFELSGWEHAGLWPEGTCTQKAA